jgi:hypothetical protein
LRKRFEQVNIYLEPGAQPSPGRQMLIGAYFTHEYSPESAALFNPSIVPHPDQSGLPRGALRFVMSLRATGEGHISSITFRTGVVSAQHRITLTPPVPFVMEPERVPNAAYDKGLFAHKLEEAGVQNDFCRRVLDKLHEDFTLKELHAVLLASGLTDTSDATASHAARGILLLAESNYEVHFAPDSAFRSACFFRPRPARATASKTRASSVFKTTAAASLTSRLTPPTTARSRCRNCWRRRTSCISNSARSTARPCRTRAWRCSRAKSTGKFVMLSRQDDENILLMFSDNIHFWADPKILLSPAQPWEFIKLGNCGSPIETGPAGWC